MSQSTSVLRRNGFTFKQFFVAHDRCAMKVGTDGILLGAWAPVAGVKRCLDIGAGSGSSKTAFNKFFHLIILYKLGRVFHGGQ